MTQTSQRVRPVGQLLRHWRERRRLSQLELALQAEISTRHLSFVETGRSTPSREMVIRLAEQLAVPLRERNQLLMAAGYAPVYTENSLESPALSVVREAVRQVLVGYEPYPAVVLDRGWNVVDANASIAVLAEGVDPRLLAPPMNVLRASLHPDGMAPRIVNLAQWREHLLERLRRQVAMTGDEELTALHEEVLDYPCPQRAEPEPAGGGAIAVPLRLRHGDRELSFISTVTTFGTPMDVTVAEMTIESFLPADAATVDFLRSIH
ncbi:helix-turn-helix domain-containing protein [Micromonospora siamensis]|uniref:DNA-binding transcriptional regulator, XRE-family HTH domain n=1 Tax=Micromonospora siamensis TaxID=299152 RepID=A0A1C5HUZ6_9ACTN|nr:helix-turn-helix transcriptional regulator [Micromonospora siamensis]SCG49717.1 DNA-binding transcriptional regulator, XRE-family HTH domain [Micromonospora siamensis]